MCIYCLNSIPIKYSPWCFLGLVPFNVWIYPHFINLQLINFQFFFLANVLCIFCQCEHIKALNNNNNNYYYWSLLYIAILRSWADSLRSHVSLHEWIAFYSVFLNIHRSGVLTALAWLVPQESAAILARSVYTIQPCTMSLHAKPHM